jgi:hypothetical protein
MQLAIGTLLLEGTEAAVTTQQAADLLPLWQAAQTLSESGSAADAEITSLYNQIQEALSPEQIEQIEAMEISSENIASLLESLGISMGLSERNPDELGQSGGEFTPPDGAVLQGGGPGGEMPVEMQYLSEEERQALMTEGMGDRAGLDVNQMLIDAVIQYLTGLIAQ